MDLLEVLECVQEELRREREFRDKLNSLMPDVLGYEKTRDGTIALHLSVDGMMRHAFDSSLTLSIADRYGENYPYAKDYPYTVFTEIDGGRLFCICQKYPEWAVNT